MSQNIRFGYGNQIAHAELSATKEPIAGSLVNLKNEWPSRVVEYEGDLIISGELESERFADFFAVPGHSLAPDAEFQFELIGGDGEVTFRSEYIPVSTQVAVGQWVTGVDEYATRIKENTPDVLSVWFDKPVNYKRFNLRISSESSERYWLRMLMIGSKLGLNYNFSYDNSLSFLTPPELVQTVAGSYFEVRSQRPSRRLELRLEAMDASDRGAFWRFETSNVGLPFFVSAYPDSPMTWQVNNYSFLARFEKSVSYGHSSLETYSADNLVLLEV